MRIERHVKLSTSHKIVLPCPYRKPHPASEQPRIGRCSVAMTHFFRLLVCALTRLFRSRARFEAEILVLRHQLNVLRRKAPKRMAFSSIDRLAHISDCLLYTSPSPR